MRSALSFVAADRANIASVLEQQVLDYQKNMDDAVVSIAFHDLKGTMSDFSINGNKPGWAASVIKIPVMIETFRAIDRGDLHLDDELIVDHCYTLEVYDHVSCLPLGTGIIVNELLRYMIVASDNEATNMLADRLGLEAINRTAEELGARRTMLAHLLAYNVPRLRTAWNEDGSNLTTAEDMVRLLTRIYTNDAASSESCAYMRSILELGGGAILGRHLPSGTIIGGKIGMISDKDAGDDIHDVGVVNGDYALSVLCNRIPYYKPSDTAEIIGLISKVVHDVYYKGNVEQLKK